MVPEGENGESPMPGERKCAFRGGVTFCGTNVNVGMEGVMGGKPCSGETGPLTLANGWMDGDGSAMGPGWADTWFDGGDLTDAVAGASIFSGIGVFCEDSFESIGGKSGFIVFEVATGSGSGAATGGVRG